MRRVRAYSRDERKRLIIHVFAEAIRRGATGVMTCTQIAAKMDIVPSTKLRKILDELVKANILMVDEVEDAGIAGKRFLYALNVELDAYNDPHSNHHAVKQARAIRLNGGRGVEELWLS